MSNAMRTSKRWLAGAAAGALTAGLIPFVAVTTASTANAVTLSNSSASVAPVRYSTTASARDVVYGAPMGLSLVGDDTTVTADDTIRLKLTTAPSASALLWLNGSADETVGLDTSDDTVSLNSPDTPADDTVGASGWVEWTATADDSPMFTYIGVSQPGTYAGTIKVLDDADGSELIDATFSFTTAGKPATIEFDPSTLSMVASDEDTQIVTASVKDADGNLTQIHSVDSITATSASTTIATVSDGSLTAESFDDSSATTLGTAVFRIVGTDTAGSTTVTGTPAGTMGTLAKPTVAVTTTAQGTTAPTALFLSAPTSQVIDDTNTDDTKGYDLNTSLVTSAQITGTGASANSTITAFITSTATGLKVGGKAISGTDVPVLVTTDGEGAALIGASWTAPLSGQITVRTGTGSKALWVVLDPVAPANKPTSVPAGDIVQKTGEATSFEVTLVDNFGNPNAGWRVSGKAGSGSSSTVATTDAAGKATISVPAPSATFAGATQVVFTVLNPGGGTEGSWAPTPVDVTYSASGDITALSVDQDQTTPDPVELTTSTITGYPSIYVPYAGTAGTGSGTAGTYAVTDGTNTPGGNIAVFKASATPANAVTVTVPEGLKVSKDDTVLWSAGSQTLTVPNATDVFVFGTQVGTYDVTFTSGTKSVVIPIRINTIADAAYNMALEPATQQVIPGAIGTATLTVTDVFGNPVPGIQTKTNDDTGAVTITAAEQILLAGFNTSTTFGTNASGEATVTFIAGNTAGEGLLTAGPANGTSNKAPAWRPNYPPPTGAPAPVTSAAATVTVGTGPGTTNIVITGERQNRSILVEGVTTNIADGTIVRPWIKFQGQTSYSEGVAQRTVSVDSSGDGEFNWQRRTGKKTYVYFMTEDGTQRSLRVIIPAR